ncbi:ANTAR domain-containing protein [Nakamurella deserti]|uniref:ANTAR domain-containing protein n=1 Tax=Nakamurella deserti TaxID=2164074 RepID=UPI000DBE6DB8|nr:ANTAR domain-containing protein [Nakamurella deserti]
MPPSEATWFAPFTSAVVEADDHHDSAADVLRAAVAALPGVDGAALCTVRAGKPVTLAVYGDNADNFTSVQRRSGQGPTVSALRERVAVGSTDLATDVRWPKLHQVTALLHIRSVLCRPLGHAHPRATTLSLFAAAPGALDDLDADLLGVVVATTDLTLAGLAQHARVRHLERALESNERIGVAVGILMKLNGYTESDAMSALSAASQAENRKLKDIAADVVLTGAAPRPPSAPAHRPDVPGTGAFAASHRSGGGPRLPASGHEAHAMPAAHHLSSAPGASAR